MRRLTGTQTTGSTRRAMSSTLPNTPRHCILLLPGNDGRASSEAGGDIPGNMYEREEEESVDTDSHTSLHLHLTLFDSL